MLNSDSRSSVSFGRTVARLCTALVFATGLLALTGCGNSAPPRVAVYPVQGKVELNGKAGGRRARGAPSQKQRSRPWRTRPSAARRNFHRWHVRPE